MTVMYQLITHEVRYYSLVLETLSLIFSKKITSNESVSMDSPIKSSELKSGDYEK